jgi:hypothetical protein
MKIATIMVAHVNKWQAKNNITGGGGKTYSPKRELDDFCKYVESLDRPFDRVDLTKLRPTTLFLLSSLYRKVIWELDKVNFPRGNKNTSCEDVLLHAYGLVIEVLDKLDRVNHLACIKHLEFILQHAFNLNDMHSLYWKNHNGPEMIEKYGDRSNIRWSPTELLK